MHLKSIELREADFKREVWKYTYPVSMKEEFFNYWSEPNKLNTKMKYEMEKTWHLGRRLARWANSGFGKKADTLTPKLVPVKPITPIEYLDAFLKMYKQRPSEVPFNAFAEWYDFMKSEGLLKPFTRGEVDELLGVYNGDKVKCRAAAVQMTLNGYINTNLLPSDLVNSRVNQTTRIIN